MSSQAAQSMRDDTLRSTAQPVGGSTASTSTAGSTSQAPGEPTLRERAEQAAADARLKAAALTSDATDAARAEAQRAADRARELAEEVQSQAAGIADQAIGRMRETADGAIAEQRDRAAGFVGSIERAVGAAARSLEEDGYGTMANYVRYASDTLSSVNDEVGSFEPARLTGRAERAVRRNPLLTYGALAVAGFAMVTLMNQQRR